MYCTLSTITLYFGLTTVRISPLSPQIKILISLGYHGEYQPNGKYTQRYLTLKRVLLLTKCNSVWQNLGHYEEGRAFRDKYIQEEKNCVGGRWTHRGKIFIAQMFLRSETFKDISQKRNNFLFPYELRFSKQIQALRQATHGCVEWPLP